MFCFAKLDLSDLLIPIEYRIQKMNEEICMGVFSSEYLLLIEWVSTVIIIKLVHAKTNKYIFH